MPSHRCPQPNGGSALGRLALTELKLFARERLRIIFGVGLPLLLVIIIGCIPFFNQPRAAYGGHATPLGAAVQALTDSAQGHWPAWLQLVTMAAYAVAFGLAAARWFRWE